MKEKKYISRRTTTEIVFIPNLHNTIFVFRVKKAIWLFVISSSQVKCENKKIKVEKIKLILIIPHSTSLKENKSCWSMCLTCNLCFALLIHTEWVCVCIPHSYLCFCKRQHCLDLLWILATICSKYITVPKPKLTLGAMVIFFSLLLITQQQCWLFHE